ncbi:MAG: DUF1822 family protein [Verrucomicrobiota bacterium]
MTNDINRGMSGYPVRLPTEQQEHIQRCVKKYDQPEQKKKVALNVAAPLLVDYAIKPFISTDLTKSYSQKAAMHAFSFLGDINDLYLQGGARLICIALLPGEVRFQVPQDLDDDVIACVVTSIECLDPQAVRGKVIGYLPIHSLSNDFSKSTVISIEALQSYEQLTEFLLSYVQETIMRGSGASNRDILKSDASPLKGWKIRPNKKRKTGSDSWQLRAAGASSSEMNEQSNKDSWQLRACGAFSPETNIQPQKISQELESKVSLKTDQTEYRLVVVVTIKSAKEEDNFKLYVAIYPDSTEKLLPKGLGLSVSSIEVPEKSFQDQLSDEEEILRLRQVTLGVTDSLHYQVWLGNIRVENTIPMSDLLSHLTSHSH